MLFLCGAPLWQSIWYSTHFIKSFQKEPNESTKSIETSLQEVKDKMPKMNEWQIYWIFQARNSFIDSVEVHTLDSLMNN